MPRAPRLNSTLAPALLMVGLGGALSLMGCQPHPNSGPSGSPNRLVVASKSRIDTVDPGGAFTFGAMQLLSAIGDPLYAADAQGRLQPRLATALPKLSAIEATNCWVSSILRARGASQEAG